MNDDLTVDGGRVNRMLWLSDTFGDHNGVSMALQAILREIRARNLPVDMMVCSSDLKSGPHLIVLKPLSEFRIPLYRQQMLRIPNFLTILRMFRKRKYDRVLCSTEGPMGLAALWLKKRYSARTFFYLHTDWIMFARKVAKMEDRSVNQLQRLMRVYYGRFDGIFVLNTEQMAWLTGKMMRLNPAKVFLTAHWAEDIFTLHEPETPETAYQEGRSPILLYAGRLSREKGVMELPVLYRRIVKEIPDLQILIAGTGPAAEELQQCFPEAEYRGWVPHEVLPVIYSSAGLLIMPSSFDTFGCVVLEALSCGLPVVAYNTKGPRDIIRDGVDGFLVETPEEMADRIREYFSDPNLQVSFSKSARQRADDYTADRILGRLLKDLGIQTREE